MRVASSLLALSFSVVACGGSAGSPDSGIHARPTCDEIMTQCHEYDMGIGEIHECHALSEADDTTEAQCVAVRAHCFEVCSDSDAGPRQDTGPAVDAYHGH